MAIERKDIGPRMSQIVINGGTVYLAGQCEEGATAGEQTRAILETIDGLLAEAGSDRQHLLSATIWLSDIRYFDEMNAVWDGWVVPGHTPARACVEARLALPKYLVEIMVTAAVA